MTAADERALRAKAAQLRVDTMRMIAAARTGHPGSSLSAIEVLTVLYYHAMRYRPDDPGWAGRDRFVLSKGHAAPALYAVLIDLGVLPRAVGDTLRALGSPLQGHPDSRTPGIEVDSGSLGQAFSVAVGLALGLREHAGRTAPRVFALLGDGECQEGQVWEAAMAAAGLGLDNLTVVVDANGIQHDEETVRVTGDGQPLTAKWRAFGWDTVEVDGHDVVALAAALSPGSGPTAVVANTVKGRGVSFMENVAGWHSVADPDRLADAVRELESAWEVRHA